MMTAGGPGSGPGAAKVDERRGAKYWTSVLHGTLRSMDARELRESERDRRSFRRARSRYLEYSEYLKFLECLRYLQVEW